MSGKLRHKWVPAKRVFVTRINYIGGLRNCQPGLNGRRNALRGPMSLADADLGDLMFRCPTTGRMFNSGFQADRQSLTAVPSAAIMRLRCPHCDEAHAVNVRRGLLQQPQARRAGPRNR